MICMFAAGLCREGRRGTCELARLVHSGPVLTSVGMFISHRHGPIDATLVSSDMGWGGRPLFALLEMVYEEQIGEVSDVAEDVMLLIGG
jgi:hypothetical protein